MAQLALNSGARLKLYVEVENKTAISVYESMGMQRYNDALYEDDIHWNPFKYDICLMKWVIER